MKKYLLMICVLIVSLSACKKDVDFDVAGQAVKDDAAIQAYLAANNITAVHDPSGLYYQVTKAGTGAYPTSTSNVTVAYTGKLLNGTVFDSNTAFTTPLTGVVRGWAIGVPHVQAGGTIKLFIPSGLGYANNDTGAIPANSVLIFTIDLTKIN